MALVAVVGLAKVESPGIEDVVDALGAPQSAVGVIIALLVLSPETLAALRNARRGRMQTSFNLALGSAIASIGLTIPAIAVASIWIDGPLVLGLGSTQIVLLVITGLVGALTVLPGQGDAPGGRRPPGPLRGVPVPGVFPIAGQEPDGPERIDSMRDVGLGELRAFRAAVDLGTIGAPRWRYRSAPRRFRSGCGGWKRPPGSSC